MCGIAGIVQFNEPISIAALKKMTDSLVHRGPDGEGHWLNNKAKVGLGHRRLSIIDLSENTKQPMHYANNRYTLTFNGEIYNYIELKEELKKKGYSFISESDTEVLLALYDCKKEKCLQDLDGMFAFAIWDEKEQTLFCARDRFGEKPFYYHYLPGKFFAFASEMKALFSLGIPKSVNNEMLYNFIHSAYHVTNPANRPQTFYTGISKLPPATFITVNASLQLAETAYWSLSEVNSNNTLAYEEAKEKFTELLYRSVKRRLRSDVPVGSSQIGRAHV